MPQLTNLDVEYVSLVDRAAVRDPSNPTEPQRFLLTKSEVPVYKADSGATTDPNGGSMTAEEQAAALKKAEEERDAAVAKATDLEQKLAKATSASTEEETDTKDLEKADLPEPVRAALQKAAEDKESAIAKAEAAEKIAKEERDLRVTREFVAKAQSDFPHLGNPEELGPRLKRMSEALSKEDYEAHLEQLTATNEQISKGALFAELGVGGDGRSTGAGTEDMERITKRAEEIRKADSSVTNYEAMRLAMQQDRDGQAAYLNAVR